MSGERKAVFLSYASQDAEAARRICEALRAAGVEVWFDQSELTGGDAWDGKIRKQIKECALFVPVISAATQARREGYFRLEWRLAVDRMQQMDDDLPFLLPVVIDATRDTDAFVPDRFRTVQWTRLPDGETPVAFCARVKTLLGCSEMAGRLRPGQRNGGVASLEKTCSAGRRWLVPTVLSVAAVAVLAVWQPWRGSPPASPSAAPKMLADKSVAVLAFENRSGEKDNEYFSDGISEELLNVLAKIGGLRVVGTTSSFQFKGKNAPVSEIGRTLNVSYLVSGSVQKLGSRARIIAALVRTDNGEQVWGDTFDPDLKDIFDAQQTIAGVIAQKLSLSLGTSSRAKAIDPEAHRLVLEGRYFLNRRMPQDWFVLAKERFEDALKLAPKFAEAHAGLAETHIARWIVSELEGMAHTNDELKRGEMEARRAIELDPLLPDGYAALGYGLLNAADFVEAERQLKKAATLSANSAACRHNLGQLYTCIGRLDAAIAEHEKAASIDPLWALNLLNLARALFWSGQHQQTLQILKRATAVRSDDWIPAHGLHAQTLLALGRIEEAVAEARYVRDHPDLRPRWQSDSIAVRVLVQAGLEREASDYAADLFQRWPAESYQRGFVLSAFQRFGEAIPFLERTAAQPVRYLFWDERWDRWRDDAPFSQLMTKLGRLDHHKVAREAMSRRSKIPETPKK